MSGLRQPILVSTTKKNTLCGTAKLDDMDVVHLMSSVLVLYEACILPTNVAKFRKAVWVQSLPLGNRGCGAIGMGR